MFIRLLVNENPDSCVSFLAHAFNSILIYVHLVPLFDPSWIVWLCSPESNSNFQQFWPLSVCMQFQITTNRLTCSHVVRFVGWAGRILLFEVILVASKTVPNELKIYTVTTLNLFLTLSSGCSI